MTDNKLLFISASGSYMKDHITIPSNIKVIYLSSEKEEIDLQKIQKISDNFIKLDFNKINDFIKEYNDYLYCYNSNEMINNNYFNIINGINTKYDEFNTYMYSIRTIQGLYQLPINTSILNNYSYPENINYIEKEIIQKDCMKHSMIKNNFTLNDIFNQYKNKKYNIVLLIMASRNNIDMKEYIDNDVDDFI